MEPRTDAGGQSPRARGLRWPVLCWLVILVLIGTVQLLRAEWFDTAVFLIAILLVMVSILSPVRGHRIHPTVVVISATALAVATALLPRHSAGMIAAVLITGALALVAAWPGAASARGSGRRGCGGLPWRGRGSSSSVACGSWPNSSPA